MQKQRARSNTRHLTPEECELQSDSPTHEVFADSSSNEI